MEEPTEYRGYTNPNVQSRSFKIIQQSLSIEEADEGTFEPSGAIPGEMIVVRAYNEGKRRREELSETHPRNFIDQGMLPKYKGRAEYYGINDYDKSQKFRETGENNVPCEIASAKRFEGLTSAPRQRLSEHNENTHPEYNIMADNISVTASILSPNVPNRRPLVVKNMPNEEHSQVQYSAPVMQTQRIQQGSHVQTSAHVQQQQTVQYSTGMPEAQKIQQVSSTQTSASIQQQQPMHYDAHAMHAQTVSQAPPSQVRAPQVSANIQQAKQTAPYNARPIRVETNAVNQKQQQLKANNSMNTIQTQPISQNIPSQSPTISQYNAAVLQTQQSTQIQPQDSHQHTGSHEQRNADFIHVEKKPTMIAPVDVVLKDESEETDNARRHVRPIRTEASEEKSVSILQMSTVMVESKTVSGTTPIVPDKELQTEVKLGQAAVEVAEMSAARGKVKLEKEIEDTQGNKDAVDSKEEVSTIEKIEDNQTVEPEINKEQSSAEFVQAPSMETFTLSEENKLATEILDTLLHVPEEPFISNNLSEMQTELAVKETSSTNLAESVAEKSVTHELSAETLQRDSIENIGNLPKEADNNSKTDTQPQELKAEVIKEEVAETVNRTNEIKESILSEELSENKTEPEMKGDQSKEIAEKAEAVETNLNIDVTEAQETSLEIIIQPSDGNVMTSTVESESFTLKIGNDVTESAGIAADSAEFLIDTTNIEIASEVDTVSENAANVNLVLSTESVNSETADVSVSEENEATITLGLADQISETEAVENDPTVADFSISLNEEINANAVADKDEKPLEKDSTKKTENDFSNMEDTNDANDSKLKSEKAEAENSKKDLEASQVNQPSDDKKSAPWRAGRARFIDSQGGVQARLQRLQKK